MSVLTPDEVEWLVALRGRVETILLDNVVEPICIAQFGSSLHAYGERVIDLDYLVVTSTASHSAAHIASHVTALRTALLQGRTDVHLDLVAGPLRDSLLCLCDSYTTSRRVVRPAFSFGPFPVRREAERDMTVYLHINGPISADGFGLFCEQLPYHACSILKNCRILAGAAPVSAHEAALHREPLVPWIAGLIARLRSSDDADERRKVLLKVMHMTCIANGFFTNDPRKFSEQFKELSAGMTAGYESDQLRDQLEALCLSIAPASS